MKRFIALFLAACLMAVPVAAEEANTPATISITLGNARDSAFSPEMTIDDVHIIYEDGIEMMELRKVAEALNYTVEWDATSCSITLTNVYGVKELFFTLGSTICRVADRPDSSRPSYNLIYLPAFVKAVDGTTYVPTDFLKEYLSNYNDISFWELQPDTVFLLLAGSLTVKMPERTTYGEGYSSSIMSAAISNKQETRLSLSLFSGEKVYVLASNLFTLSVGDMQKDLENLGGELLDETSEYVINDLTVIDIPFINDLDYDIHTIKYCLVKDSHERLYTVGVYMNKDAREQEYSAKFANEIIASLSDGTVESSENFRAMGFQFNLPENYEPILSYGVDFSTLKIIKITTSDYAYYPTLGIYEGFHPSTNISYLEKKSVSTMSGELSGKTFTWYIMEDGSMEALVEHGYGYYHFYTGPLTDEERNEFIDIVSNITTSDID